MNEEERDKFIDDYMAYINHRFTVRIFENKFPKDYRCSKCGDGFLEFVPDSFHKYDTLDSAKLFQCEDWEPDWVDYIFSGALRCVSCCETYIVTGTGKPEEDIDPEEGRVFSDVFYPKFFLPTINIFPIPHNTPEAISEIIKSSFSFAWADYSASGNKLRVALELIVDKLVPNSAKSLGNKINDIPDAQSDIRDMIKVIKWLGNQGSHEAKLEEYDLAFSFKVIERVLKALYPDSDDTESLMAHVKMINMSKGSFAKK
ncbi:DUF4145 domain-containing protein [Vibrio cholerae]|jgi:hypothetical protein|nr:DUF4145 domain-containing protein [Vibrio cholerae]